MANTDFSILLKTMLDKSGINTELEQVQKIVNKYSVAIMPELQTASLRNQMKSVAQDIANDFNKAFGTNLTGNDVFKAFENQAKQAQKAIKDQAKAVETARKEQEALNERIRQGQKLAKKQANESFTSKQTNIYKEIIKNQEQIYALKKKLLSADALETEEINKQIHSLEVKNKYNRDYKLANNGMIDSSWDKIVQESKEALENQYRLTDARKTDSAIAQESARIAKETAQAEKERLATLEKQRVATANSAKEKAKSNAQQELTQQKEINTILSKQESAYKEIWNINKQIATLDTSKNSDQISALNEKKKFYQEIYLSAQKELQAYNNIAVSQEHLASLAEIRKKAESEIGVTVAKQNEALAKVQAENVNKIQHSLDVGDYDAQIETIKKGFVALSGNADEAETHVNSLRKALQSMHDATDDNSKILAEKNYRLELEKTQNELTISKAKAKEYVDAFKINKLRNDIEDWLKKNTAATKAAKDEMRTYLRMLDGDKISPIDFNEVKNGFDSVDTSMRKAGKLGKSLTDTFKEGAKSFAQWTFSSGAVMEVVQSVRLMVDNVVELDEKLLELSKVSDLSADGLAKITEEAYELSKTVGKTGTQVLDAITTYKRAGFDLAESTKMAEDALKMTNVAEGIDEASTSAQYLISIMKGYQDTSSEFSKKILDSINEVSNTQAVDFDNLADGAQRLSAVANQAGVSFDQMLGTLTGGYEVLGNMEKTASGLITIFTRLQSIQLSDEEEVESVAKLQESFSSATNGVVNIVDQSTGQLRGAYDILSDLNEVWDTLDKNTQEGLAFAAGGTRQKSVFLSIMSNWESVEKSVQSATDSMGSADVENQKYLDSLNGKISQFESAVESLSNTLLNSDLLGFFVDFGTGAVNSLDTVIDKFGTLGTLATIGSGIAGANGLGLTNYVTYHSLRVPFYKVA